VHNADSVVLMSGNGLSFQICRMPNDQKSIEEGREAVAAGLKSFNENKTHFKPKEISVFMRDKQNKVAGGAIGYTYGDWFHLSILWVEESFRNRENGTKLLKMLENEAAKLGCKHVETDTFSWQARPFYEKQGYTLFAALDNCPEGHKKYFLKKDLK